MQPNTTQPTVESVLVALLVLEYGYGLYTSNARQREELIVFMYGQLIEKPKLKGALERLLPHLQNVKPEDFLRLAVTSRYNQAGYFKDYFQYWQDVGVQPMVVYGLFLKVVSAVNSCYGVAVKLNDRVFDPYEYCMNLVQRGYDPIVALYTTINRFRLDIDYGN